MAVRDCLAVSAVPPSDVGGRQHCFKLFTAKRDYVFQVGKLRSKAHITM